MINIKYSITVATSLLLTLSSTAYAAQHYTTSGARASLTLTPASLSDLKATRLQTTDVPQCFETRETRCPDSLQPQSLKGIDTGKLEMSGGIAGRSFGQPADKFTSELPKNLRVMFVVETIEHEIVSGDGVLPANPPYSLWKHWEMYSSAATYERYNDAVGLPAPGPGQTWPIPHYNLVYDGLVIDGCGNTPVFPIELTATIVDHSNSNSILGGFITLDNSTLIPNGYWEFSYSVPTMDSFGSESVFHVDGWVSVLCSNKEDFQN